MLPRHVHLLHALLVLATIAASVGGSLLVPDAAAVVLAATIGIATVLGVLLDSAAVARPAASTPPAAPDLITVDLGRRS